MYTRITCNAGSPAVCKHLTYHSLYDMYMSYFYFSRHVHHYNNEYHYYTMCNIKCARATRVHCVRGEYVKVYLTRIPFFLNAGSVLCVSHLK